MDLIEEYEEEIEEEEEKFINDYPEEEYDRERFLEKKYGSEENNE